MRVIARVYATLLLLGVTWAWWIDVSIQNTKTEHLLPDVVLALLTLPSSLLLSPLYETAPEQLAIPFVQLGMLTVFAFIQGAAIFWLAARLARARKPAGAA
jgi:hypothetical protein